MLIAFFWLQQVFAVGDAGALSERQVRQYEHFWKAHAQKGDILLLLGDNLYPAGYRGTRRDSRRWGRLVRVARAFPGEVWAVPGNHDWKAGIEGILRQAKDIPHKPSPGYRGPDTLIRGPFVFWFLDSEPCIQAAEGIDTIGKHLDALLSGISSSQRAILVLHHPPLTVGSHGGYFPLSAHIFPLRVLSPYLYLPLPGIGTAFVLLRKAAKHPTDKTHPGYAALAESLLVRARRAPFPLMLLSGHDHNLQIHALGSQKWAIVSGSGCKTESVARRKATWARAVVGLWKISPSFVEAYAVSDPDKPIWKFVEPAVP